MESTYFISDMVALKLAYDPIKGESKIPHTAFNLSVAGTLLQRDINQTFKSFGEFDEFYQTIYSPAQEITHVGIP